ncbi:hypothetical protein IFM12275_41040 [Nocardia sputorum]|uniref:hypothetical protein n=1 Tax=Nocardia TaxID=1817 RepID=UPI002454578C|nr:MULTISPECIES: hypothetical protein [Nocardia]BDT94128.1 hypothetical protein IFM12275_41040 [Nocardia sputorum]
MITRIVRKTIAAVAGIAMIGALGVATAQVATADQVYPYSTSPYFGGQVYVSTAPGNITIRAVQTTVGAFPYGCWANARNMEGNWSTGSRQFVQVFPRVWQASFDGLPGGRYEVMQRCGDGTSLIRERSVVVELGGGSAVTPEEQKPLDPGQPETGTCSERISRIFSTAGIPTQLALEVIDGLRRGPGIESSFQLLCAGIENDPAAVCRSLQAGVPVDTAFGIVDGIYDEIDRLLGQQNSQDRDAIIQGWQNFCSAF